MAVELPGGCRIFGSREGEPRREGPVAVRRLVGRESGARAISLAVLELDAGAAARWRNGECDEVLFVADGAGHALLGGERHALAPRTGVFVRPGQEIEIRSSGPAALQLLDSRCPDPGPRLSFDGGSHAPSPVSPLEPAVVRFEEQAVERADDGRWFRVLVDAKIGCDQTTQFVGFVPPGRAPDHFHEYEEVVCILEGEGRFWSGPESAPIAAGSCIYLPRRQPHCVENTGAAALSLYGLFHPSGSPAVRFDPAGIASGSEKR
jgi:mannose-6-phosphate isomerase-like protein (cupin superfamily)